MSQITLKNIYKKYQDLVLDDINISVNDKEFISLLGHSGVGKSTLLKIIAGLEVADSGKILFDEKDFTNVSSDQRNAVILFQDYRLFPHMNVEQNIEFGLKVRGIPKTKRMLACNDMLKTVYLSDKAKSFPSELSGGEKQRAALARACILNPKVLLLDEPFSNLDTNLKASMRDFLTDFQKKLGITTIMVTHDIEDAFMLSEKVAILLDHKIVQYDKPATIYNNPATKELSDFLGETNYITCKLKNGHFVSDLFSFPATNDEKLEIIVRLPYNSIELTSQPNDKPCTITSKTYCAMTTLYKVEVAGLTLTLRSKEHNYQIGQKAYIILNLPKNPTCYSF